MMRKEKWHSQIELATCNEPVFIEQVDLSYLDQFNSVEKIVRSIRDTDVMVVMKIIGSDQVAGAFTLPNSMLIRNFAELFSKKGAKYIFYIRGVDRSTTSVSDFRNMIVSHNGGVNELDSVLSISYPKSAGYQRPHVDAFNVLIVQLSGKRNWTIWDRQRRHEFISSEQSDEGFNLDKDSLPASPIDQLILCAGQCLYIPFDYPHFAVATEGEEDVAISLAISWSPVKEF